MSRNIDSEYQSLSKPQLKYGLLGIAAQQFNGAVVIPHNLAGNGQTNARTVFLGGIERNEDLLLGRDRNGLTVVGHVNDDFIIPAHLRGNVNVPGSRLQGVLDKIDENL